MFCGSLALWVFEPAPQGAIHVLGDRSGSSRGPLFIYGRFFARIASLNFARLFFLG